jgi:hypothetical protein
VEPKSAIGGIRDRLTLIAANAYFDDCREERDDDGNVIYEGYNLHHKQDITSTDWYIYKKTYDVNGNRLRREGPLEGAWSNRGALDWDIEDASVVAKKVNKDVVQNRLLEELIMQMKIMNLHLSILTNEEITNAD